MEDEKQKQGITFDDANLSVKYAQVEVGETYPIYGMITEFVCDVPGSVVITVNNNIELSVTVENEDKLALLKSRCFEPGIFVCKIEHVDPAVRGTCSTIVFGKNTTSGDIH